MIEINNLGENSVLGFFAKDWFENFQDMYSFDEYMLDQKNTVIDAKFYPKDNIPSELEKQCIQSNRAFCEKYEIILNVGIMNSGEQKNEKF